MYKTAVITGASSGIGKEIALELAKESYNLFLTGRNLQKLVQVSTEAQKFNRNIFYKVGDVSVPDEVKSLYSYALSKLGTIDILIANAGVGYLYDLEKTPLEKYDEMFNTNVKGVFLWLKQMLHHMKARNSGQIIVTSSTAGLQSFEQGGVYCATKHALQGMIGSLRQELEGTNIKVATINPGAIDTPWFDRETNFSDFDRSQMLKVTDISKCIKLIIDQAKSSNIEKIVIKYS